jgi:hypothetical protein
MNSVRGDTAKPVKVDGLHWRGIAVRRSRRRYEKATSGISRHRASHMENAINRNKVTHTHEVVSQLTHWWDDEVFEKYPTWEECEGSGFFSRPLLIQYFGETDENGGGGINAVLAAVCSS